MILGAYGTELSNTAGSNLTRENLPVKGGGSFLGLFRAGSPGNTAGRERSDRFARDDHSGSWLVLSGHPVWEVPPAGTPSIGPDAGYLLEALTRNGLPALDSVDGSFAIAWWDAAQSLFRLVRDRFGAEPLHYALAGDGLVFGSRATEIAGALDIRHRLSTQGLVEFLAYCYLPGTTTLFEGIRRVPPGAVLEWKCEGTSPVIRSWYRLSFASPWKPDEAAIAARYRELLEAGVERRLGAGRAGVFLSGGMDSSSVATFMRRSLTGPIASFSFRCGGTSFDESSYARALAEELGLTHAEVQFAEPESLTILEAVTGMDSPFCDIGIELGTWLLSRAASGQVDYVLTGDGGDELWASHPVYAAQRLVSWFDRAPIPQPVRRTLVQGLDLLHDSDRKRSPGVILKRIIPSPDLPVAIGHFRWRTYYTPAALRRLFIAANGDESAVAAMFQPVLDSFEGYDGPDDGTSRWLYSDYRTASGFYFSRLQLAREFGLEIRMPFYDRQLVEYGARIPARLKLEGVERTKRLFRAAMEGILPDIINHRKDKLGHSVPLKNWIRTDTALRRLVRETLEGDSFRSRQLFNPGVVQRMLAEHDSRRQNHSHRLWALFVLELWLRRHVDGA